MSGNTFGKIFRLTTFGESHGLALGGIVDGCPSGIEINEALLQRDLDLRKPGKGVGVSARQEPDQVKILSGVFEGKTTGTPLGFIIENKEQKSKDYTAIKDIFRPGHADFSYTAKYGIRDYRGGGRASARETAARVAGGSVAMALLKPLGINLSGFCLELGGIRAELKEPEKAESLEFFAPDANIIPVWQKLVTKTAEQGDSLGGIVQIEAYGVPTGLGEPVFDKLDALIAHAFMSIGAVKGVEIGAGFSACSKTGSSNNDQMQTSGFLSNEAGGILGGISTGQPIIVRAAVKPIPSIAMSQKTIDINNQEKIINIQGRHDCQAVSRIVPVLKAMLALVLADAFLLQKRMS